MRPSIRFGLELPPLLAPADAGAASGSPLAAWRGAVVAAERGGFGSVWVTGSPAGPDGAGSPAACDPCTLAGGLVPLTTSLVLGVVSGVGPGDRNPSVLARDVTALDVLSSGRAAAVLQLDAAAPPPAVTRPPDDRSRPDRRDGPRRPDRRGGPRRSDEAWGRLSEAAAVCRLLFTEEAPTFEGRHFRLSEAANRPRPVQPGGPLLLVQAPGPPAADLPPADAWVVTGGPAEVAAWRQVLSEAGGVLLWRGELSPGGDAIRDATALHDAGADGLIVRVAPTGEVPAGDAVASTAQALLPLLARWAA